MYFKIFLIFMFFLSAYAFHGRIVNGTDAGENEFPYAVSLRSHLLHMCGGTILNSRFILTAAHCVYESCTTGSTSGFSIQYGSNKISPTNERSITIKKITCANFDIDKIINDAAVLELNSEIPEGNWSPVKIAKSFDGSVQHTGVIIGWGRLYDNGPNPEKLQKATMNIYDDKVCGMKWDIKHHICFGAPFVGACKTDSGTALLIDGVQVGIASFITAKCGVSNEEYPNVYARIPSYYDWIAKVAGL